MIYESTRKATREELIERIKELEADKEIKNKMINDMAEELEEWADFLNEEGYYTVFHRKNKEEIKQYFENKAKESGEIDEC